MSKKNKGGEKQPDKPVGGMALAANWPIHEVLLSEGWQEEGALASILVARRSPITGKIAAGSFLVDLACLGLKQTHVKTYRNDQEYRHGIRTNVMLAQPTHPADFHLVAKIVLVGIEYAASLGFKPDAVFTQSHHLLTGADPARPTETIPVGGSDGQPFFIAGPYDDVPRILNQLTRAVGADNFHYFAEADPEMVRRMRRMDELQG
jgi:hypothetical protein